jgi:low affinity Fe/Cu permease
MAHQLKIDLRGRCTEQSVHALHKRRSVDGAQTSQTASPVDPVQRSSAPHDVFRRFAHKTSTGVGSPWAFVLAVTTIVVWAVTGPLFHFSDTWQLVINTGTTIITFLMVFLIQNTQNRDAVAIHLKLDELIRALKGARNQLVDLEELSDEELEQLHREFKRLGAGHLGAHPYTKKKER